jgi:hypothetical protein
LVVIIWAQVEEVLADMDRRQTLPPDMVVQADRHPHLLQAVRAAQVKTGQAEVAVAAAMVEEWAVVARAQAYMEYLLVPHHRQVDPIEEPAAKAATVA